MKQLLLGKGLNALLVCIVAIVVVRTLPKLVTSPIEMDHRHRVDIHVPKDPIALSPIKVEHDLKPTAPVVVAPIKIDHQVKPLLRPGILFPLPKNRIFSFLQAPQDHKYAPLGYTKVYGGGNCSMTIVGPRASDGYYYALFSRHCCPNDYRGYTVTVAHLKDHPVRIYARWFSADISMIQIKSEKDLPYVMVAERSPKVGDKVWHKGNGVDKPGNIETGTVVNPGSANRKMDHSVYLSPGDSGSGLFADGTMLLVGVNHSYSYPPRMHHATSHGEVLAFLNWCHPDKDMKVRPYVVGGGRPPVEPVKPGVRPIDKDKMIWHPIGR